MIEVFEVRGGVLTAMAPPDRTGGYRTVSALRLWLDAQAGRDWSEVVAEVLEADKAAVVDWPDPAAGKVLDRRSLYLDPELSEADRAAALAAFPEANRFFVGNWAVFSHSDVNPPATPVPAEISNVQFFEQLMFSAIITPAELNAWSEARTMPAPFAAAIATYVATLPEAERLATEAVILNRLRDAGTFPRNSPFIGIMQTALSMTPTQMDDFFRAAALL